MRFITPELNATLNSISAVLLVCGYFLIKQGNWRAHATMMICATVISAVFLVCYVTYHAMYGEKSTTAHPGLLRDIYLVILLPHLVLAIGMLPMILATLWRAYHRDWSRHRRIARPTFWIWLYVSVTGVIVYFMLYHTSLSG